MCIYKNEIRDRDRKEEKTNQQLRLKNYLEVIEKLFNFIFCLCMLHDTRASECFNSR